MLLRLLTEDIPYPSFIWLHLKKIVKPQRRFFGVSSVLVQCFVIPELTNSIFT